MIFQDASGPRPYCRVQWRPPPPSSSEQRCWTGRPTALWISRARRPHWVCWALLPGLWYECWLWGDSADTDPLRAKRGTEKSHLMQIMEILEKRKFRCNMIFWNKYVSFWKMMPFNMIVNNLRPKQVTYSESRVYSQVNLWSTFHTLCAHGDSLFHGSFSWCVWGQRSKVRDVICVQIVKPAEATFVICDIGLYKINWIEFLFSFFTKTQRTGTRFTGGLDPLDPSTPRTFKVNRCAFYFPRWHLKYAFKLTD